MTVDGYANSNVFTVPLTQYAPQLFQGNGIVAAVNATTGKIVTASTPAKAGDVVELFGNGLGPVSNTPDSGGPRLVELLACTTTPGDRDRWRQSGGCRPRRTGFSASFKAAPGSTSRSRPAPARAISLWCFRSAEPVRRPRRCRCSSGAVERDPRRASAWTASPLPEASPDASSIRCPWSRTRAQPKGPSPSPLKRPRGARRRSDRAPRHCRGATPGRPRQSRGPWRRTTCRNRKAPAPPHSSAQWRAAGLARRATAPE